MSIIRSTVPSFVRALRRSLPVWALMGVAACEETATTEPYFPGPGPAREVTQILISDVQRLTDGDVREVFASVRDQYGYPMPLVPVRWSVGDARLAAVSDGGILTAIAEGTTELRARAEGVSAVRVLTIARHPAARLEVTTPAFDVMVGSTRQAHALVRGLDGRVLSNRTITWQSADPSVARVNAGGQITAVAPGQTTIVARHGAVESQVQVKVSGVATTLQVASIGGAALPFTISSELLSDVNGITTRLIERLERGVVLVDGTYDVQLTVGIYRQQTFQGNVIEQRVRQRVVHDQGLLEYHWLDGSARLLSAMVGGLTHDLRPAGADFQLGFRIGGTNDVWQLQLRR